MGRPLSALGELGEVVVEGLKDDAGSRSRAIVEARRRLLERSLSTTDQPPRTKPWALGLAFASVVAVALTWLLLRPAPLAFQVDGREAAEASWLAASGAEPMRVSFTDGTRFEVAPASRARVVETRANGADIALESGALSAEVVHTSNSAWQLIAGPFAVRVTGTRFDMKWDPGVQEFSILVREGSVVVSGSIVGSERAVRAGQRLAASVVAGTLELRDQTAPPASAAPATSMEPAPLVAEAAAPSAVASPKESGPVAWRELAKSGDLKQAFSAAEAHGFQAACDSASPAELLLLGDAARVSGRAERANEALLTLRRRYPQDPRRAAAAFALGKVAFDQRRAYAQAAAWFATCMAEQPQGSLAREAAGRRLEALKRAGDAAGARKAAQSYVERYPDGPHAAIARAELK